MDGPTTSDDSWKRLLSQSLRRPQADGRARFVLVGVGQTLRGDDGAGAIVAQRLSASGFGPATRILDSGPAPENFLGAIVRFAPDVVVYVDVAEMGLEPGAIRWLAGDEVGETMATTHTLSLGMSAKFLTAETGCEVYLLGIQPLADAFDAGLSAPVEAAVTDIVATLRSALLQGFAA